MQSDSVSGKGSTHVIQSHSSRGHTPAFINARPLSSCRSPLSMTSTYTKTAGRVVCGNMRHVTEKDKKAHEKTVAPEYVLSFCFRSVVCGSRMLLDPIPAWPSAHSAV